MTRGIPRRPRHRSEVSQPINPPTVAGLLALAVTFSAGIHAALVPEHLDEVPLLGDAFIVAALVGAAIAAALVVRPDNRRIPVLAGLFCLGQIAAWILFVTVRVACSPAPRSRWRRSRSSPRLRRRSGSCSRSGLPRSANPGPRWPTEGSPEHPSHNERTTDEHLRNSPEERLGLGRDLERRRDGPHPARSGPVMAIQINRHAPSKALLCLTPSTP
jgi:hypothetical protein